jgi:hypothetical protein
VRGHKNLRMAEHPLYDGKNFPLPSRVQMALDFI